MGVGLSPIVNQFGGTVQDVRLNPAETGAVLYMEQGADVDELINYFVVNSSDGYAERVQFAYRYFNAVDENEVTAIDAAGLYKVAATLYIDGTSVRTQTFYVCVTEALETAITLSGPLVTGGTAPVYGDAPLILHSDSGGSAFTTLSAGSIDYTRLVFDYEGEIGSAMRIILKGSNNTKVDLSTPSVDPYTGISIEVNRYEEDDGQGGTATVVQTKIHVRDNGYYWVSERTDVEWNGEKNILTARFDEINGVIDLRLVRSGVVLMSEKIRTDSMISGDVGGMPISSGNIRNVIGIGYVGMQIGRAHV